MQGQKPTLRVRINHIDNTVVPSGHFDNSVLPEVPVLRVFGESSSGQKTCVHIHQVYPYIFIEYPGKLNAEDVNRYIAKLTLSLNHAIAISMKRNPGSLRSQFIRAILLVKGVHFYGFHTGYTPFLKILIADPSFVNRAVTILQSGTVMKTRFCVYESHLSFTLQFLCDFGLYGCGWLDLAEVWQRGQDEDTDRQETSAIDSHDSVGSYTFKPSPHFRQSRAELEVDVAAHQILNRHLLLARNIHHKLTIPAPPLPSEPLVLSVRELWEDERRRRLARGLSPSPEIPKDLSANSRSPGGAWVSEARWWEEIMKRIELERDQEMAVCSGNEWEKWVMTTFESIQALWEKEWRTWKPELRDEDRQTEAGYNNEENPYQTSSQSEPLSQGTEEDDQIHADVDVSMLSSQAMSQIVDQEEANWQKLVIGQQENEDETPNDEDATEDGPPPVGDNDLESMKTPTKTSSLKRPYPFENSLLRSSTPTPKKKIKSRASSVTPTQNHSSPLNPVLSQENHSDVLLTTALRSPRTPTRTDKHPHVLPTVLPTRILQEGQGRPDETFGANEHVVMSRQLFTQRAKAAVSDDESDTMPLKIYHLPKTLKMPSFTQIGPVDGNVDILHADQDDTRAAKRHNSASSEATLSFPSVSIRSLDRKTTSQQFWTQKFSSYNIGDRHVNTFVYARAAPSTSMLLESLDSHHIYNKVYRAPYYSRDSDVPERPKEYAGLVYRLKGGKGLDILDDWVSAYPDPATKTEGLVEIMQLGSPDIYGWEYASSPPSAKEIRRWLKAQKQERGAIKKNNTSQIEGPTQMNPYGLKGTLIEPSKTAKRERRNMTVLSMEVFAPSHNGHVPDAGKDEAVAVFYSFQDSDLEDDTPCANFHAGLIVVDNEQINPHRLRDLKFDAVATELDLLNSLVDVVMDFDPDIVIGWEVQAASWGYINARAHTYGFDIGEQISRAPARYSNGGVNQWGTRTTSTFNVVGRHVFNLWRIIRSEQTLNQYTFENVVFHLLRRRTPRYSPSTLTNWYNSAVPERTLRVLHYFSSRTSVVLEMLDAAQIVTKTAEFARVFGVDFFSVLSRGSQFKVESFMFRIAKPESFVLLSPSKEDVGKQNAAECMPLIMEPLSAFYNSPLVVLDFQSLYPSIMIAYNYCYSTCLGRITDFKGQSKLGVTDLRQPPGILDTLKDHINVAPNGIMYVKPEVRKGLLGRMLTELLDTRVMVKQAMKSIDDDKALKRILDARQLGLKFISNVTYGYTSATFSGRMPAVEIADSIVQSGRETLEKAIRVIDSTKKWGAKVVYGDTDSLFIYLRGKTKEQAFRIGHDMADTLTSMNPAPVKMKFEKVYLPCVLMAKKRYVGFKFESPDDKEPTFDAKGIETVRRDGIPAQQKMTENCLKILFRTQDLSEVKDYCCRSWMRILENKASVQDFIFAKEVKMGTYSDTVPPPPGVTVAARRMENDSNDEPQYGERIPYVIIRGEPNTRLVDRAVAPHEVLDSDQKYLDAAYYISKVLIPPLERIFNLVGADVRSWYDDMPKSLHADQTTVASPRKGDTVITAANRLKIDEHFLSSHCFTCGAITAAGICDDCRLDPQTTIAGLLSKLRLREQKLRNVQTTCASCAHMSPSEPIECESLDCPWMYERKKVEQNAQATLVFEDLINELEESLLN